MSLRDRSLANTCCGLTLRNCEDARLFWGMGRDACEFRIPFQKMFLSIIREKVISKGSRLVL
jgi:hypothetical protein